MSGLPKGWATVRLEELTENPKQDIVDGPFGSNLKASEYVDAGIPIVRLQNIDRNCFLEKNIRCVTVLKAEELSRHSFLSGDVIVTKLGDPVGKACIVPTSLPKGIIVADVVRARIDARKALKEFVAYAINSPEVVSQLNLEVKGSTRPRVNLGHIRALEVPLPPLNEQLRIVAKLEAVLGKVDACQQRLAKIPVILKRFRQAVLAAACSGRLTADWREEQGRGEGDELPEGWCWTTVGEHCTDSFYGPRFAKEDYSAEGIPTIRTTDFSDNGSIVLNNPPCILLPEGKKEKFLLREKDLLVTRTGSIGKMAIFRESYEALPSAYLIRFRFASSISVDFILQALMSPRGQELLGLGATAVTQPNINAETIKALQIPCPPLPEQHEIVSRVEALFTLADQLEARYLKARAHVDRLTQSVLAKAFRGELVPQDENDEPAAALLERIRAVGATRRVARGRGNASPLRQPTARNRAGLKPAPTIMPMVAETSASYGRNIPQAILAHMRPDIEYSRADIAGALGLSTSDWNWAIRQLKEEGKVVQTGERRGARYQLLEGI